MFGPFNAMHRLCGCRTDRAHGVFFRGFFRVAIVTFTNTTVMKSGTAQITGTARLDQRNTGFDAQTVDVAPCTDVVQSIGDDGKLFDKGGIEFIPIFDVAEMRNHFHRGVETKHALFRNQGFWLAHVFLAE